MKTFFSLFLIALFASCATVKLPTTTEPATVFFTDSTMCVEKPFTASINEDSLLQIADKGFIISSGSNSFKIYWQAGNNNPANGQLVLEPNLCILNNDYCLMGQYWIQVSLGDLAATLKRGMTFGTPQVSIFVYYYKGNLTAIPKVCIKTAATTRALR